jgi:5-methylcytosine-specific restriction endonuclease McrA
MDYRTGYLRSPEWRRQRAWLLAAIGYRCHRCGTYDKHLDVHHLTYANLGAEEPDDIVALCRRCHGDEHA